MTMINHVEAGASEAEQEAEPFLAQLRRAELAQVFAVLRQQGFTGGRSVLEIGGGTGWQARDLQSAGYKVRSVDVESNASVFPVEIYDGRRLPCADRSCDVVFSSNVLEHVPHIDAFQAELHRVLKPGGIAIHLMPTPTWRLATLLAHYPWLVRAALSVAAGNRDQDRAHVEHAAAKHGPLFLLWRIVLSPRHGETGNAFTELWHFSARRWNALFERHGWRVAEHRSNELFYTGYSLLGTRLSMKARRRLAHALGGSCRLYVLKDHVLKDIAAPAAS
jgi:SAM-dependent methyltransferase